MASRESRSTSQKRAMQSALGDGTSFQSAQDLYFELKNRGERIGLTTVYQQLKSLADSGEVDVLRTDDGEALYRRCDTHGHHHHLVCRSCGGTVEVEGAQVERWTEQVAAKAGYRDIEHTVEVFGTCPRC